MVQDCCRAAGAVLGWMMCVCVCLKVCVCVCVFPCCHGEDLPNLSFIHGSGSVFRPDSGVDSFETSQRINCY